MKNPQFKFEKYWLILVVYISLFSVFTLALSNKSLPLSAVFESFKWVVLIISFPILVISIRSLPKLKITKIFIPLFVFIIFQAFAAIFVSPDPGGTVLKTILMIYLVYLGIFFSKSNSEHSSLKPISFYFGCFCCYVSGLSFISTLLGITPPLGGRLVGLLDNANMMGALAAVGFSLQFNQTLALKKARYALISCIMIYIVYLTQSRAALYGSLIIAIYTLYLYNYLSNSKNFLYLIVFLIGFFAFYYLNNAEITIREFSLDNRIDLFSEQIRTFHYSPWVGIGLGDNNLGYFVNLAESTYISLLPSSGVLGSLAFMSLLVMLFFSIRDKYTKISFVLISLLSLSEAYLIGIGNPISIYFYLLIGSIRQFSNEKFKNGKI
ncbi:O-antigen ligase family protein [Vibrio parahaemolyticus]